MRGLLPFVVVVLLVSCVQPSVQEGRPSSTVAAAPGEDQWATLRRPLPATTLSATCPYSRGRIPNDLPGAEGFATRVSAEGGLVGYVAYGASPASLAIAESVGGLEGAVLVHSALAKQGIARPKVIAIVEPGHPGPLLVRAGRLDGATDVTFGSLTRPSEKEIRLTSASGTHPLGYLEVTVPGCYVVQLDAPSFSSRVTLWFKP